MHKDVYYLLFISAGASITGALNAYVKDMLVPYLITLGLSLVLGMALGEYET